MAGGGRGDPVQAVGQPWEIPGSWALVCAACGEDIEDARLANIEARGQRGEPVHKACTRDYEHVAGVPDVWMDLANLVIAGFDNDDSDERRRETSPSTRRRRPARDDFALSRRRPALDVIEARYAPRAGARRKEAPSALLGAVRGKRACALFGPPATPARMFCLTEARLG
jgi:hypothetical protein